MLDHHLDGNYKSRSHAIQKCAKLAQGMGYSVFAIQDGGWCASGPMAQETYQQCGPSNNCKSDCKGGPWANQVYEIETLLSGEHLSINIPYEIFYTTAGSVLQTRDQVLLGML